MSEQPATAGVPTWDLADRMRKSLRQSGVSVQEMADYLNVSPKSVSNWINGRIFPPARNAQLWALRTGVPYTWLCHGNIKPCIYGPETGTFPQVRRVVNNMHYSQTKIAS